MTRTPHRRIVSLLAAAGLGLAATGCGPDDRPMSTETGDESDTGDQTTSTDTGDESDTGETGEDPEPIAVNRGLLASTYTDGVLRYVVHDISEPDASPLAWSFEPGQQVSMVRSRFGTHYATVGEPPVTHEIMLDADGFVDMRPLLPLEVPQLLWAGPYHGPNDDVALGILGYTDLYELHFDPDGRVSSARELFVPPPGDVDGQFAVAYMRLSETHAVFSLAYVPAWGEEDWPDPSETIGVWGLPLDGTSMPELLVDLEQPFVEETAPYVVELVGDQLVYGDDPDLDGDLDLYTKPVDDPDAPAREICPGVDGSVVVAKASPVAGELLCIRQLGHTSELFHVDLADLQAPTELLGERALNLAYVHVLDADRVVFVAQPNNYLGPIDKGASLMLAERVAGVWQDAVQITESLTHADAGIYKVTYGLGGVVYAGADGDESWLSWIDLSGPNIPPPIKLVEDIGSALAILLPDSGTRLVFSSRPGSAELAGLDLSDPEGSRVELRPLFPDGWGFSGQIVGLVNEGQEVVFGVDGPRFLARMPIDGSRPPIQTCEESDVLSYEGELLPP